MFSEACCKKINIIFFSLSSCLLNYTRKHYRVTFRVICFMNRGAKPLSLIGALEEKDDGFFCQLDLVFSEYIR